MVRITPELVENAPQFTNAIKDRELDLHGYKFQALENLGCTLDQFDTIDLSENEFRKLDGFPLLKRLRCLILSNNKIMRVVEDLGQHLPNIETLILNSNSFTDLRELDPLASLQKITFLSLLHSPVTMRANYRLYVISLFPNLRFLDYKRVTQSDRKLARTMFKRLPALSSKTTTNSTTTSVNTSTIARSSSSVKTFVPGAPLHQQTTPRAAAVATTNGEADTGDESELAGNDNQVAVESNTSSVAPGGKRPGGSTQDLYAIQEAIKRARTMDEVERLHHLLSSGQFQGFAVQWQQHLRRQQQEKQQSANQQATEGTVADRPVAEELGTAAAAVVQPEQNDTADPVVPPVAD